MFNDKGPIINWGYLKENEVNKEENKARAVEPEKVVPRLNHRHPFHHLSSFLNSKPHFGYNHL